MTDPVFRHTVDLASATHPAQQPDSFSLAHNQIE